MSMLRQWWRQPEPYEWITGYMKLRGMTATARLLIAFMSLSLSMIPLVAVVTPSQRRPPPEMALEWLIGLAGVAIAIPWIIGWPTRRQSLICALASNATVALWSLLQPQPLLAFLVCTALILSGGYLALFHAAPYTVYSVTVAAIVGGVAAVRLWQQGDHVHAFACYWLIMSLNAIAPFAVRSIVHALGADMAQADVDPLTGLLNRRGFRRQLVTHLADCEAGYFMHFAMIDLDQFKRLNDTRGHAVGDAALVAVAQVLRDRLNAKESILCRAGGEEFLLAWSARTATPPDIVAELCEGIAALPFGVTVSIGVACEAVAVLGASESTMAIDNLIASADAAMYQVKRLGGNGIHRAAAS